MTHTNCIECNVKLTDDNWYPSRKERNINVCIPCYSTLDKYTKRNSDRMFVNGKYVPTNHPLHKAGRYKSFNDAAFSSLNKYQTSNEGEVYIVTNKAWKGWLKVGMAIDAEDRCNGYQTGSPLRDYKLRYSKSFNNRRKAETKALLLCSKKAKKRNGEWFKMPIQEAKNLIETITEECYEKETA